MEKRYDVFVSCKSEDYTKAEPVFHWLVEKGHNPFFAPISLRVSKIQGEPIVFGDEIDDALEQADNMVLYASKAEYVSKGYVKDEWRTFVEEQRAGRKSGSLVTILDGVNSIGEKSFFNCRNLEEVVLSGDVAQIGIQAFSECPKLKTVYFGDNKSEWVLYDEDIYAEYSFDKKYLYKGKLPESYSNPSIAAGYLTSKYSECAFCTSC